MNKTDCQREKISSRTLGLILMPFALLIAFAGFMVIPIVGVIFALPVLAFAFLLAFSANLVGKAFDKLTTFERWARRITGVVAILAGLYLCLTQIFYLF